MRSENNPGGQKELSFIEEARRKQIIESAIVTFTELGYANASLARIAERAGVSKGVISYHFAGKAELMEQVVERVYRGIAEFAHSRMEKETTAAGELRADIRAVAEYMRDHRVQLLALGEIRNNFRGPDGRPRYGVSYNKPIYEAREALFRRGQQSGEFRPFDPFVMSITVQGAVDAMFAYWATHPDHDLEAHANEVADLFVEAAQSPEGTVNR